MSTSRSLSAIGGISLITGTCIGAGALALPITTFVAGFWPSVALFIISWGVMCLTGLLYLEAVLFLSDGVNILSLAEKILGKVGKGITWVVYLYLFYSLTISYIAGSGDALAGVLGDSLSRPFLIALFVLIFGFFVYRGTKAIEVMNVFFVLGLAVAYITLIALGLPEVKYTLLSRSGHFVKVFPFLPIILTSFGYQGTVPSLVADMKDPKRARMAIIIGSFLPLIAYIAWQVLILGIVPSKALSTTFAKGGVIASAFSESPALLLVGEFFAFFALASSFLGVGLGLRDFLADGFKVEKTKGVRFWICLLIYFPAFVISLIDPRLFILALQYGGGIGGVLLLGILPILLVWQGRYVKKLKGPYRLWGGRFLLIAMGVFFLASLGFLFY